MERPELHDPRVLRAIAHPVRNRILTELDAAGSLRAADVAQLLGIPANQASFHLRQLAKFGLVEENPDAARDKRDRVWRATDADGFNVSIGTIEKAPGGKAASAIFRRTKAAWAHQLVEEAYGDERTPGARRIVIDQAVRLTKTEAGELSEQLTRLVDTWRERTQGHQGDQGDQGDVRRTYSVLQIVQPLPEGTPDRDPSP